MTERRRRCSGFVARFVDHAPREFAALPRRIRRQITARLRLLALAPRKGDDVMFMWGAGRAVFEDLRLARISAWNRIAFARLPSPWMSGGF